MLIDLHVHSRFTAGCDLDPERVLKRAESAGLEGVCFTDLNTLEGASELHALRARTRLAVLVGVKIATDHGHYLGYFPDPENAAEPAQIFGKGSGALVSIARLLLQAFKADDFQVARNLRAMPGGRDRILGQDANRDCGLAFFREKRRSTRQYFIEDRA